MATKEEIQQRLTRYNPGGFPKITSINAVPPPTPTGSVVGAVFRQENTIGNVINRFGNQMPAGEITPGFEPINYIPPQNYEFADRYVNLQNQEQVEWLNDQIAQEMRDKAVIAGNPWRAFFAGMASSVVDLPGYLLPGGVIYSNASRGLNVARSAASVAGANFLAQSISEGILQQTQYARSVDESVMNVFSAALIGAAMGGVSSSLIPKKIAKAAVAEASDVYANGSPTRLLEFNDDGSLKVTPKQKPTPPTRPTLDTNLSNIPESGPGIPGSPTSSEPNVKMGDEWAQTQNQDIGFFRDFKSDANPVLDYDAMKESASLSNLPDIAQRAVATNPFMRSKLSQLGTVRSLVDNLVESTFGTNATDLDLVAKSRNLETRIHASHFQYMRAILEVEDVFLEQRGLVRGPLKRTGAYMEAMLKGREMPGKSGDEFWTEVSVAIRNNDLTGDPHVLKAAKIAQTKILNPLRDEAIRLGLLPKNVAVQTANSYLMRIWNRQAIIENRQGFETLLLEYYEAVNDALRRTLPMVKNYEGIIARAESQIKTMTDKDAIDRIQNGIKNLQDEIEGLKFQEIKGQRAAHLLDTDGNWRAIQTNDELRSNVTQTMENILSLGDDRLLNPLMRSIMGDRASPLKNRELLMPDNMAQPYLVNDAITILERYVKSMSSIVEATAFSQERGFADINSARTGMKAAIRDEWEYKSRELTGKDADKLKKDLDRSLRDVDAMWDILLGVYGSSPNSDNAFAILARGFREWNVYRLMGSVTLASIPDLGTMALRYGPYELIHESILPLLKSKALRNLTKDELQSIGFACNTAIGMRIKGYADTADLVIATSQYGKILDTIKQGFGNVTLVNQWSDIVELVSGTSANNYILKNIDLFYKTGKISTKEMRRLARVGISKQDFEYIHSQWKKYGGIHEGSYFANTGMWEINTPEKAQAFRKYKEAIISEIRSTLVRPTIQDKPLSAYTELGKTMLQFKSFGFAATNKIFMSALQNRDDINTITGLITLLSLGALGYVATSLARGNEPNLEFLSLSKEAIDRSGILGMFSEYYNVAAKLGAIPGQGSSRYRTRGKFGAVGGPTVGAVEDIAAFIAKITDTMGGKPLTTKDVDVLLRLMPYQNLFYAHQLSRTVAKKAAVQLGAREVPERRRSDR